LLSLLLVISKVIFISIFINWFSLRCSILLPNTLFSFLISVIAESKIAILLLSDFGRQDLSFDLLSLLFHFDYCQLFWSLLFWWISLQVVLPGQLGLFDYGVFNFIPIFAAIDVDAMPHDAASKSHVVSDSVFVIEVTFVIIEESEVQASEGTVIDAVVIPVGHEVFDVEHANVLVFWLKRLFVYSADGIVILII
jgi:hypothetical protein